MTHQTDCSSVTFSLDDVVVSADDLLPPCVKLEKYAASEVVFNRQIAARNVLETLRCVTGSDEDVGHAIRIFHTLADDYEPTVRMELMQHVPRMAFFCKENFTEVEFLCQHLLPVIVKYLTDISNQVRKTAHSSLLSIIEQDLLDIDSSADLEDHINACHSLDDIANFVNNFFLGCLKEKVLPVVLQLTESSHMDDHRTEAVALMSKIASLIGKDATEHILVPRFTALCVDSSFHVRKVCAENFGEICAVVGKEITENVLLPKFALLCEDSVWGVRKACAEVFMPVSCVCSMDIRHKELAPMYRKLICDQSRWVRTAAFQSLGPFISTFAKPGKTGLYCDKEGKLTVFDIPGKIQSAQKVPVLPCEHSHLCVEKKKDLSSSSDLLGSSGENVLCNGAISCDDNLCDSFTDGVYDSKLEQNTQRINISGRTCGSQKKAIFDYPDGNCEVKANNYNCDTEGCLLVTTDQNTYIGQSGFLDEKDDSAIFSSDVSSVCGKELCESRSGSNGGCSEELSNGIDSLAQNGISISVSDSVALENASSEMLREPLVSEYAVSNCQQPCIQNGDLECTLLTSINECESSCPSGLADHCVVTKPSHSPSLVKVEPQEFVSECDSAFNHFQFWRIPLPEVHLDSELLEEVNKPLKVLCDKTEVQEISHCSPVYRHEEGMYDSSGKDSNNVDVLPTNDTACTDLSLQNPAVLRELQKCYQNCEIGNSVMKEKFSETKKIVENISESLRNCDFTGSNTLRSSPSKNCTLSACDQDIVPPELLMTYLSMTDFTKTQSVDAEIARHCAYSLPAVALTLGRKFWPCLKETYDTLASDMQGFIMQWKVRRTLASSMYKLAVILGPDIAARDLLPVFSGFIRDLDEVRIGILQHLAEFLEVLRTKERQEYLPRLSEFLSTDNDRNWRFRLCLAEQLVPIAELYEPLDVRQHLTPLAVSLLRDKVAEVRKVAVRVVAVMVRRLSQNEDSSLTKQFLTELGEQFLDSRKWLHRQLYVYLCQEFVKEQSLPCDQFAEDIMPQLFYLCWDRVANVRLAVARCLAVVIWPLGEFSDRGSPHRELLLEAIHVLQGDVDGDVKYFANMVATDECSCLKHDGVELMVDQIS